MGLSCVQLDGECETRKARMAWPIYEVGCDFSPNG